jgi:hypothetical protein
MMKLSTIVLAFGLSVGMLFAQDVPPPGGHPWGPPNFDALKSYLQLSDAQVTSLTALQTSFRDAAKPIHQQIMAKEKDLRTEMAKASPDSTLVAQLLVDIKNLRSQIKANRDALQPQALAILTDAQKSSLAALQQALSLQKTAHEAVALGLIAAPQNSEGGLGFGFGRRGMRAGFAGKQQ